MLLRRARSVSRSASCRERACRWWWRGRFSCNSLAVKGQRRTRCCRRDRPIAAARPASLGRGSGNSHPRELRPQRAEASAAAGLGASCSVAPEGRHAQRRVRPPAPRCAHGALLSPRAAGPPDVSPPRRPAERDNRSGRRTYGGTTPSRQAGVSSTACASAIVHNQGITVVVRVVDCYGRKLPALLHGDVLAWAATGRLAPTPQHRGHPRRRVKLL